MDSLSACQFDRFHTEFCMSESYQVFLFCILVWEVPVYIVFSLYDRFLHVDTSFVARLWTF